MSEIFLKLFNMSITASWLIAAVVLVRFLFRKAPKSLNIFLWALVALRLIFPFSFQSVMSLVPSSQTIPDTILSNYTFTVSSGINAIDTPINDVLSEHYYEGVTVPTDTGKTLLSTLGIVWLIGTFALLVYSIVSYLRLRKKVSASIKLSDNIFVCDEIDSPFILGIIRPKIYLSSGLTNEEKSFVIAHEKAHLKHLDHLWKPLGFLLLSVYWFNPLMWLSYVLLCKDIELACDERVIKNMNRESMANYSRTLLGCATNRKMILTCPVAFGEVGIKERVKNVLSYKKPAFWVIIVALIVSIIVGVCFMTNPKTQTNTLPDGMFIEEGIDLQPYVQILTNDKTIIVGQSTVMSYAKIFTYTETKKGIEIFDENGNKTKHTIKAKDNNTVIFDGNKYVRSDDDIEEIIHEALLEENHGYSGEYFTEGHIILGEENKNSKTKIIYLLVTLNSFGFENDCFVNEGGMSAPAVMTVKMLGNGTYDSQGIEYPEDGSNYSKSIKRMFPKKYQGRISSDSEKDSTEMWNQCVAQAESYLEEIGRKGVVCRWGDLEHYTFTDVGMPVDVSNNFENYLKWENYYEYIGSKEVIEDGTRYVYRTDISSIDGQNDVLIFEKINYETKETVKKAVLDVKTGAELSPAESQSAYNYRGYYGLDTRNGLVVYAIKMSEGSYSFVLAEEKADVDPSVLLPLETAEGMKIILSSYKLDLSKVKIKPIQHTLSSYLWDYEKEFDELEESRVRQMLGLQGCLDFHADYFDAKVIEVKKDNVLVENIRNFERYLVSTKVSTYRPVPDLYEGLYVRVTYNGVIMKTDPGIISDVYAIELYGDVAPYGVFEPAYLDIDNDGTDEFCTISFGPTSGLFTVVITAFDDGEIKYKNTFCLNSNYIVSDFNEIAFNKIDGTPGINLDGEFHKLYVKDNRIVIDNLDSEFEGYWGGSEWNYYDDVVVGKHKQETTAIDVDNEKTTKPHTTKNSAKEATTKNTAHNTTANTSEPASNYEVYSLKAKVKEVDGKHYVVERLDGETTGVLYQFNYTSAQFKVGDIVIVEYKYPIAETYPNSIINTVKVYKSK